MFRNRKVFASLSVVMGITLLSGLTGCKDAGVSKEEEKMFKEKPTGIPPDAQKMIAQKMRESQQKMQQQAPPTK